MTSDDSLMLYAKLAGFRLAVLANRSCCDGDFSRELHDRLIDGLDAAIDQVRTVLAWERRLLDRSDECASDQLAGEGEILRRMTIDLLDEIDIDYDTHEYRINGGRWTNALMVDDTGVHVDYPDLVLLDDQELGSLAPIVLAIRKETGLAIRAGRVDHGHIRLLHPDSAAHGLRRA
ncbi:hypothetical protein ELH21_09405 [Rhizobium leguminosarum]|uniref:hypothetical protein n=1 Tax=Rhizobium leguminosarum TaxID=384 RepID=UPI001030CBB2|nr:hypothetical protein [Rhizobium leguminosarum]TBD04595.1 hypothetical protein ELH21_09405 [Rhizobium leguminosarum]